MSVSKQSALFPESTVAGYNSQATPARPSTDTIKLKGANDLFGVEDLTSEKNMLEEIIMNTDGNKPALGETYSNGKDGTKSWKVIMCCF